MRYLQGEVRREDAPWLPASPCALCRIPIDAALFGQDNPPPHRIATLHEAARALGIRTGACTLAQIDWRNVPCPIITFDLSAPVVAAPSAESAVIEETATPDRK